MERYEELREAAKKKIWTADHMLTMTYPLVKDPRLLVNILENIFLALTNSIGALLYYEQLFKRIPNFQENFISKFNLFRDKCAVRYNIDKKYFLMIQEIKDVIAEHNKSPVEFTRKDCFVICSDDYQMKTISSEKIKSYIALSKSFIQAINSIIDKNQGMFDREIGRLKTTALNFSGVVSVYI